MSNELRTRLLAAFVVVAVIPLGLVSRSFRSAADVETAIGFLATYAGDTLWPIMFYFIGRFLLPRCSWVTLFVGTLALTVGIEYLQLWKPPLLQWLRAQPISGFMLGSTFIWSDVVCCSVGTVIAALVDLAMIAMLAKKEPEATQ